MKKKFKFTNASIKALPANPKDAKGTDLEVSDTINRVRTLDLYRKITLPPT